MALNNIWVFAQGANGAPTSGTLELLTKARSLGGTVSAFVVGDGAAIAAALVPPIGSAGREARAVDSPAGSEIAAMMPTRCLVDSSTNVSAGPLPRSRGTSRPTLSMRLRISSSGTRSAPTP